MARRKAAAKMDESALTKGQLRKLNALRKSVGDEIGERTFAEWLRKQPEKGASAPVDRNAERIVGVLEPLIKKGQLRIRRGGYLVRRGRGRVIVESAGGS